MAASRALRVAQPFPRCSSRCWQERADARSADVGQAELAGCLPVVVAGEGEQEPARVAVGRDRVRAGLLLPGQPVGEESLQDGGEVGHGAARLSACSSLPPRGRGTRGRPAGTSRSTSGRRGRARWTARTRVQTAALAQGGRPSASQPAIASPTSGGSGSRSYWLALPCTAISPHASRCPRAASAATSPARGRPRQTIRTAKSRRPAGRAVAAKQPPDVRSLDRPGQPGQLPAGDRRHRR